ncbi:MAG: GH25 family lysozyme [Candidatus Tumulicola sp.]
MTGLKGIDVSYAQGDIDWHAVRAAGIAFAFIKATEGASIQDAQFARNWPVAKSVGIHRGAYHFFHFSDDPVAQAHYFLASAKPQKGDLLPAVDVETADGISDASELVTRLSQFTSTVEKALKGRRMVVYTNLDFWSSNIQGSDAFAGHPLWVAEYNRDPSPALPQGWRGWTIWQHDNAGTVNGITGAVDLDVFNGATLKTMLQ